MNKFTTSLLENNTIFAAYILIIVMIISFMLGILIQKTVLSEDIEKNNTSEIINNGDKVMIF